MKVSDTQRNALITAAGLLALALRLLMGGGTTLELVRVGHSNALTALTIIALQGASYTE